MRLKTLSVAISAGYIAAGDPTRRQLSISPSVSTTAPFPSAPTAAPNSQSINATFSSRQDLYFDTDGNLIGFYNDDISYLGGQYVWYSNSYQCQSPALLTGFCGIQAYISNDLTTWQNVGFLFDPNTTEVQGLCDAALSGNCGRPHIVYSNTTATYVLYVNSGSPGFPVFTSGQPTSGYVYRGRSVLPSQSPTTQVGDLTAKVIDGIGYAAYSLIDFTTVGASIWPPFDQSIYIVQLTNDLLDTTGPTYHAVTSEPDLVEYTAESPVLFKRDSLFYLLASNNCGFCNGTLLVAYRSASLDGSWTRQILSGDSGGGQLTGVLPLPSPSSNTTEYLLYLDHTTSTPNELFGVRTSVAGKTFRKLRFAGDGAIQHIDFSNRSGNSTVELAEGSSVMIAGNATNAIYGSSNNGDYALRCDLGLANIYQTFQAPRNGQLVDFAFNVATNGANGPLQVILFRASNLTALISPHYVWETLSTHSFPADSLGVGVGTLGNGNNLVVLGNNTMVNEGDLIGAEITNSGSVPVCYLYSKDSLAGSTLLKNGANQVSPRGARGRASPVFAVPGSIKFYVNIVQLCRSQESCNSKP